MVMLDQCVMTEADFSPVKWSPSLSEKCGEYGNPDLSEVLTTVTDMIVNNKAPSSLPKSCVEVKESSPVIPSGYYTISKGSGESGVVVYCNIDDLSSCPALEQTLSGIRKDVESLFTQIDNTSVSSCTGGPFVSSSSAVQKKCPDCKNGFYENAPDQNNAKFVYCIFENSTYCNVTGPWVKLASWSISEAGSSCSGGLQLFVNGTVSPGIQKGTAPTCQSLPLFSPPVPYTQACGRMRGYQKGSVNAF